MEQALNPCWKAMLEAEKQMSREDRGRDWRDTSTSQGMPRTARSHQKLGDRHGIVSASEPPEGTDPTYTLT